MNNTPFQLPKLHWKIFFSSFIPVFIMVSMQMLGIHPRDLFLSPLPEKTDVFFEKVQPKLEIIPKDTFSLRISHSFISKAHASGAYDAATAYVVLDFTTGDVLAEKNSEKSVAIASLTKIMTAVVALDLATSDELLRVSKRASIITPTKIGVVPGEQLTLHELLEALLMTSANDAAAVIREGIDQKYGDAVFVKAMNAKARLLGMKQTHFDNPQGFDGKNYSSAKDLSLLTHYAMKNYPLFSEIVKKDYTFLPKDTNHKQFDLHNWNGLIGVYPDVIGVKIGNTDSAGKTTVVLSEREGIPVLVVLLGAPRIIERDLWAAELLDEAYKEHFQLEPIAVTEKELQKKYLTWQTVH